MVSAADRYRTLLDAASAVADQPSVKAVLHSLRGVLSNISCVYSAGLYLLTEDRTALKLFAYDREADGLPVPIGTEVAITGVAARVVEKHETIYLPDVAQEMLKFPQLAPFASRIGFRRCYLFPVATSRKQYGLIAFTSVPGGEFSPEDVELMGALASHVAVAVESALSTDAANLYQQQLVAERDRLSLLLEINNHIASQLEVNELFHAVAGSMRTHFGNDGTEFRLINKQSGRLELTFLDFPTSRGFWAKVVATVPSKLESEWWRLCTPQFYAPQEMPDLPPAIREAVRAESLLSGRHCAPRGRQRPLGPDEHGQPKAECFQRGGRRSAVAGRHSDIFGAW